MKVKSDWVEKISVVALDMTALALQRAKTVMDDVPEDPLHAERYIELADRLSQVSARLHGLWRITKEMEEG